MSNNETLKRDVREIQSIPPSSADIIKEYFRKLSPTEFDAALEAGIEAGDYNRLYSLAKHYESELLPASISRFVSIIIRDGTDQDTNRRRFEIFHLLTDKWRDGLQPEQEELLAEALINHSPGSNLYKCINNRILQFSEPQFNKIIKAWSCGYNVYRNQKLLVERYGEELTLEQLVQMIKETVQAKQEKMPEIHKSLDKSYAHNLWMWEFSHDFDEPKPKPYTKKEKEQYIESQCQDMHELLQALAEQDSKDFPSSVFDWLISGGDLSGNVLRTLVIHHASRLSQPQRQEIKARLGASELLAQLINNDSPEIEWIKSEIKDILDQKPVSFAKIANEKVISYLSSEDIDLVIKVLVKQNYREDFRWKSRLCSSLLSRPENLLDEQFYAIFNADYDRDWCAKNAAFFTPERVGRFLETGPRDVVIRLVSAGAIKGDERLKVALEKCGGHPGLVKRCGHLFEGQHIDELIKRSGFHQYAVSEFVDQHLEKISKGQFCAIIRMCHQGSQSYELERKCIKHLSEHVDEFLVDGEADDLELLLDLSPGIFSAEHAPELLRRVESAYFFEELIRRFIKDLQAAQVDECLSEIYSRLKALAAGKKGSPTRKIWAPYQLDRYLVMIIHLRDDLTKEQIQRFMDNPRGATAKALLEHHSLKLSPAQTAEIVEKFAHVF